MDDRIRISDADREGATARLREHFAEGRLSSEELDERISAALSAKTAGDLRRVLADLPEPETAPAPAGWPAPPRAARRGAAIGRRPRIWPLAACALIAALLIPGAGWLFLAFFQVLLLFWLVTCVAGIFAVTRLRRRMRRYWSSGDGGYRYWHHYRWPASDWPG